MATTSPSKRLIGRRGFLGVAGGLTVGAVATACARDEYRRETFVPGAAAEDGMDGHGVRPVSLGGGNRPEPSGDLATIYDPVLPPVGPEPTKRLIIEAIDAQVEVAGGVKLNAWTFGGTVPGPIVHVREGDTIDFTLRNNGAIGHSLDFHAAQVPPDVAYATIVPGDELSFTWRANYPGVFMYHCGTGPVLEHVANGMYGAVVVDPAEGFAPAREYVFVQSEFYLKQGANGAWDGDPVRMAAVVPDFVVFNGAANQYRQQPVTAAPGELVRMYVVNAGPSLFSAFHVIGTIFDRTYPDGNPANVMRGVSTWTIPPGGAATFELVVPDPGSYPIVTHSFAYTGLGAVGVLEVR